MMDLDELDAFQNKLATKIIIPEAGQGWQLRSGEVIFTLDVQYKEDEAFVAVDFQIWGQSAQEIFAVHEYVLEPYVPGYFAFREGPVLLNAIEKVKKYAGIAPNLIIVDGHGLAHPRKFGVACWLGLELNLPTMGCAKDSLLRYTGELESTVGSTLDIVLKDEIVGYAIRTSEDVKPIFVSPGHLISLEETRNVIMALRSEFRIIEPLRRADYAARCFAKGLHNIPMTYID